MSASDNTQPQVITTSPAITALPTGDELVINLPEGQKVLLGKLPPGTIIEIASWRGTGPPDHHTARILLSTTTGAAGEIRSAPVATTEGAQAEPAKKTSKRNRQKQSGPQHRKRISAGQIIVITLAVIAVFAVAGVLTLALLN